MQSLTTLILYNTSNAGTHSKVEFGALGHEHEAESGSEARDGADGHKYTPTVVGEAGGEVAQAGVGDDQPCQACNRGKI